MQQRKADKRKESNLGRGKEQTKINLQFGANLVSMQYEEAIQ